MTTAKSHARRFIALLQVRPYRLLRRRWTFGIQVKRQGKLLEYEAALNFRERMAGAAENSVLAVSCHTAADADINIATLPMTQISTLPP